LRQRCVFDMGIPFDKEEDDDEFIDKMTY
jgi:hypothetical protein